MRFAAESAKTMLGLQEAGAGDLDADGVPDFLVGAPGDVYFGGPVPGMVYLFSASLSRGQLEPSDVSMLFLGEAPYDKAGLAFATGSDLDGDGWDDLAVGAPLNSDGALAAGKVYVVSGGPGLGDDG